MTFTRAFTPEELAILKALFEEAIATLHPSVSTSANKNKIAQRLLACAASGEHDLSALKAAALSDPWAKPKIPA